MDRGTPVKFTSAGTEGQTRELAGKIDRPPSPRAWAIFAHCFTCSKDILAASRISAALAKQGIATLRFDFTGLGQSGGDFADTTFSSNLDDLVAAADYLRQEHEAPSILIGHSLGGAAVLGAAHRIEEVKAIATIGAPFEAAHVEHLFAESRPELDEKGIAEVNIGGRPFRMRRAFVEDLKKHCSAEQIGALRRALLVMHAPLDKIVGIENAGKIFGAARHPKSFVSLDGADHLLRKEADAHYAGLTLAAWASRYLPPTDVPTEEPRAVEVRGGKKGLTQSVFVGPHMMTADEPPHVGGEDLGPTPYEYVLAGLGACTSMTLRMYANRKGWSLDGVRVFLEHKKIHAKDCETCETEQGRLDQIDKRIVIEGALDDEQRQRLLEIADKCPVHRTLHNEVVIKTKLAD